MAQNSKTPTILEIKTWRLHNTPEEQGTRVARYLETGLMPALTHAGGRLAGAFSVVIGENTPSYVTVSEFASMTAVGEAMVKLTADAEHKSALEQLNAGSGLPFVRVESSLLRSFAGFPQVKVEAATSPRVFEMRTYEAQSFPALVRKVAMFNDSEAQIFERLGFRPVFFGETIVGAKQPNLTYMLSYESASVRDRFWQSFINDPEWKKISSAPELKDSQVVENITNMLLAPLSFSPIR